MITEGIGARLKVIGRSMESVTSGPIPGSTPMNVPTSTPTKQYRRFCIERATVNPKIRLSKSPMLTSAR
jgi:hypothetical protein